MKIIETITLKQIKTPHLKLTTNKKYTEINRSAPLRSQVSSCLPQVSRLSVCSGELC